MAAAEKLVVMIGIELDRQNAYVKAHREEVIKEVVDTFFNYEPRTDSYRIKEEWKHAPREMILGRMGL